MSKMFPWLACGLAIASVALSGAQQSPLPVQPTTTVPNCPELAVALTSLMRNDNRLRDWPNLTRYREPNRALAQRAASDDRVVFFGDSITDAWPEPRYGTFFVGKPYVGRGISGQTTSQMLVRFRQDVIDLGPRVVVMLAGTNDIAGNTGPISDEAIEGNLASMAELAKAHDIRVVLSSITPVSSYHVAGNGIPQTTSRPMTRIRAINAWIEQYAAANRHVYLDYFTAMVDKDGVMRQELSRDDLHPNAEGYAVMAPLAEAAIKKALTAR